MRLGSYACELKPGSRAHAALRRGRDPASGIAIATSSTACTKRRSTDKGLQIVGRSLDGKFVEIIELPSHPWYVAVQFHPEFKSKPLKPHPLFAGFVEASHGASSRRTSTPPRPW